MARCSQVVVPSMGRASVPMTRAEQLLAQADSHWQKQQDVLLAWPEMINYQANMMDFFTHVPRPATSPGIISVLASMSIFKDKLGTDARIGANRNIRLASACLMTAMEQAANRCGFELHDDRDVLSCAASFAQARTTSAIQALASHSGTAGMPALAHPDMADAILEANDEDEFSDADYDGTPMPTPCPPTVASYLENRAFRGMQSAYAVVTRAQMMSPLVVYPLTDNMAADRHLLAPVLVALPKIEEIFGTRFDHVDSYESAWRTWISLQGRMNHPIKVKPDQCFEGDLWMGSLLHAEDLLKKNPAPDFPLPDFQTLAACFSVPDRHSSRYRTSSGAHIDLPRLQAVALVLGEYAYKGTFHLGTFLPELPMTSYTSTDIQAIGPSAIRLGLFLQLCRNYESYKCPQHIEEYECAALNYSMCFPFSKSPSKIPAITFAVKYARGMTANAMPFLSVANSMSGFDEYQNNPDKWILHRASRLKDVDSLFGWVSDARHRINATDRVSPGPCLPPSQEGASERSSFPSEPHQMYVIS